MARHLVPGSRRGPRADSGRDIFLGRLLPLGNAAAHCSPTHTPVARPPARPRPPNLLCFCLGLGQRPSPAPRRLSATRPIARAPHADPPAGAPGSGPHAPVRDARRGPGKVCRHDKLGPPPSRPGSGPRAPDPDPRARRETSPPPQSPAFTRRRCAPPPKTRRRLHTRDATSLTSRVPPTRDPPTPAPPGRTLETPACNTLRHNGLPAL